MASRPFSSNASRKSSSNENAPASTSHNASSRPARPPYPSTTEMQRVILSSASSSPIPRLPARSLLASKFRKSATKTTDPYVAYGVSRSLFRVCNQQADYTIPESRRRNILTGQAPLRLADGEDLGVPVSPATGTTTTTTTNNNNNDRNRNSKDYNWWFDKLSLPPTFSTWTQVTLLHLYLLVVRLRALTSTADPSETIRKYQLYLIDNFSHAAEEKMMLLHGMTVSGMRNKHLKDLFLQWRGLLAAYDEGLVRGDAVLATAVWRNLWRRDENVDWVKVAHVVGFMRSSLMLLAEVDDGDIMIAVQGYPIGSGSGSAAAAGQGSGLFEIAKMGLDELVERRSAGLSEERRVLEGETKM